MIRTLSISTALACCSMASAAVVLGSGDGFLIDGSVVHSSSIVIGPSYGTPLQNLNVEVRLMGLQHDFLGDLVVTLTHVESGATATIFDSVGNPPGFFGSPAVLDGSYVFNDNIYDSSSPTSGSFWAAADAAGTGVVPTAFYYATGAGSPSFVSMDAAFASDTSSGTWRLDVVDTFAAFDDGALFKWVLVLNGTPVPAPGAIALLGFAGVLGRSRRR